MFKFLNNFYMIHTGGNTSSMNKLDVFGGLLSDHKSEDLR